MQRRHQKIVEESPAPALDGRRDGVRIRAEMHGAALRIVELAGYVNAGTCEFLVPRAGEGRGDFYFLEVNARLQVEHPVTEMITGLDLVEEQLRIASGERLSEAVRRAVPKGHSIEVRVYAENPERSFFPSPGKIDQLRWPGDVRVEAGVRAGDAVTSFYDPLIAKIISAGADRSEARARLAGALAATEIAPLVTNLAFLRRLIDDDPFVSGVYDTTTVESTS
jgi:acetyl/propionyl-CoA carboxylase alpha subunit